MWNVCGEVDYHLLALERPRECIPVEQADGHCADAQAGEPLVRLLRMRCRSDGMANAPQDGYGATSDDTARACDEHVHWPPRRRVSLRRTASRQIARIPGIIGRMAV